jgi:protein TonB
MSLKYSLSGILVVISLVALGQSDTAIYLNQNKTKAIKEKAQICITRNRQSKNKYIVTRHERDYYKLWYEVSFSKIKILNDTSLRIKWYSNDRLVMKYKRIFSPINDSLYSFKEVDKNGYLFREGYTREKFPLHLVKEANVYYENGQVKHILEYDENRCIASQSWLEDGTKTYDDLGVDPDSMPTFPGGAKALFSFIQNNMHYPKQAAINNIQGKVLVQFVVTKEGYVSDVVILKGVHPLLDAEAKRVMSLMPKWNPGGFFGEVVNVRYQIPINFMLTRF